MNTGDRRPHIETTPYRPPGWLDAGEWKRAQDTLPIACVDVLPIDVEGATLVKVGFILRETPHEGQRWCLVGGRLGRNETLSEAVARQLHEALGDEIRFQVDSTMQPAYVAQYFTELRPEGGLDPRQHAIGLSFCVPIVGGVHPCGEALEFSWFDLGGLPAAHEIGFNQDRIVAACLAHVNADLRNLKKDEYE